MSVVVQPTSNVDMRFPAAATLKTVRGLHTAARVPLLLSPKDYMELKVSD